MQKNTQNAVIINSLWSRKNMERLYTQDFKISDKPRRKTERNRKIFEHELWNLASKMSQC